MRNSKEKPRAISFFPPLLRVNIYTVYALGSFLLENRNFFVKGNSGSPELPPTREKTVSRFRFNSSCALSRSLFAFCYFTRLALSGFYSLFLLLKNPSARRDDQKGANRERKKKETRSQRTGTCHL